MAGWVRMNVLGARGAMSFGSEPDVKAWADRAAINPARIPPASVGSAELDDALDRLRAHQLPGPTWADGCLDTSQRSRKARNEASGTAKHARQEASG